MTHGGRFLKLYITGTKDKVTGPQVIQRLLLLIVGVKLLPGPGTAKITATINGSKISKQC